MTSPNDIDAIRAAFQTDLAAVANEQDLQTVRDRYLGRKQGAVAALMKSMADAPPADRPAIGKSANLLKREIDLALATRKETLEASTRPAGSVDVTLPGREMPFGRRHPLTLIREQVESIFGTMGFEILQGPQVEDDYHNFEALNMPPDHPARDMQDTFYLDRPMPGVDRTASTQPATLLRTHTSGMQIRYMENHQPPVRIIAPGLVYRRDTPDLTHSPMFLQVEGLLVDDGITMADLKGTLVSFLQAFFDTDIRVMFRPSFFPYTEPSAEVFISCVFCGGDGCPVCKKTGWLEILGCGMVHPAVFEAVGYDPERYTGWAFGLGIDRVALLKHRVEDIRLFYDNDLRLLEQFPH
ncbi:MAG: phenylalanine--tRNA ligase subunit alpha [Vicinamibacterales bacterium]|jgi:phenylalanyl-tRNA synthetase alpha chain|nr:phenylalanine--tRNA ligase subunit alpha [Vicinamibacterales bacterium]|tara:strand:+ start:4359 stop:5420 length:1062 start_codon:yes stop_codon:yes gene_type:complete